MKAIAGLPKDASQAMTLRYQKGLMVKEIAEIQRVPVGTVKARLARGIDRVQGAVSA
jgi:RNA polymerase sigma factor (sigma-70 family)